MNLRKIVGLQGGVQDFRFQIIPRSISLPKHIKCFIVYLQKGMQIIGKFESDQNTVIKQSFYKFRKANPAIFHISTLLHCNYTWSLYSINLQTNQENFQDSTSFNIERTVKLYQMELLQKQRQIQTSIKQKNINKPMILTLWDQIKKDMKTYRSKQTCLFSNQNYQIQFQIQIKNILDFQLIKANEQEQRRRNQRRNKSNESSIHSSPSPSSIKSRIPNHQAKAVIELDSTSYLFSPKEEANKEIAENSIKTKETIQGQEFNATVKIMNPKGQQIKTQGQQYTTQKQGQATNHNSNNLYVFRPLKKFSILSDIIEQSYEGSSSYGHYDRSSSNDAKVYPALNEATIDMVIQKQESPFQLTPFNKVRTLPHQSRHLSLQVKDRFRRAQTSQKKTTQQTSQIQEQSIISINNTEETPRQQIKESIIPSPTPKKGIIITVVIFVFLLLFLSFRGQKPKKRRNRN